MSTQTRYDFHVVGTTEAEIRKNVREHLIKFLGVENWAGVQEHIVSLNIDITGENIFSQNPKGDILMDQTYGSADVQVKLRPEPLADY